HSSHPEYAEHPAEGFGFGVGEGRSRFVAGRDRGRCLSGMGKRSALAVEYRRAQTSEVSKDFGSLSVKSALFRTQSWPKSAAPFAISNLNRKDRRRCPSVANAAATSISAAGSAKVIACRWKRKRMSLRGRRTKAVEDL